MKINKLSTLALLTMIVGFLLTLGQLGAAEDEVAIGTQVDEKAPDFSLPLLDGAEDEEVNLYEQLVKYDVVIICFFVVSS